jgi:hypothetical protein
MTARRRIAGDDMAGQLLVCGNNKEDVCLIDSAR